MEVDYTIYLEGLDAKDFEEETATELVRVVRVNTRSKSMFSRTISNF